MVDRARHFTALNAKYVYRGGRRWTLLENGVVAVLVHLQVIEGAFLRVRYRVNHAVVVYD